MRFFKLLFAITLFGVWNFKVDGQEVYAPRPYGSGVASEPFEADSQFVFTSNPSYQPATTLEELSLRLNALETKENLTESELKKLTDAKKPAADKPKYPNVAISGVFQADAVSFSQLESSRQANGSVETDRF